MSQLVASYLTLKRNADFGRVYRRGRYLPGRAVVLHVFSTRAGQKPRVGFTVSRRVRGAVERNRVKRRLREALRTLDVDMAPGVDFILTAKDNSATVAFPELQDEVAGLLRRAGVVGESS